MNPFYPPVATLDASASPYFWYSSPSATASPPTLVAPNGATSSAIVQSSSPTFTPADTIGMSLTLGLFLGLWIWLSFRR